MIAPELLPYPYIRRCVMTLLHCNIYLVAVFIYMLERQNGTAAVTVRNVTLGNDPLAAIMVIGAQNAERDYRTLRSAKQNYHNFDVVFDVLTMAQMRFIAQPPTFGPPVQFSELRTPDRHPATNKGSETSAPQERPQVPTT